MLPYVIHLIQFSNAFQCFTRCINNSLVHVDCSRKVSYNASTMGRSVKQSLRCSTTWLAIVILAAGWKVLQNIPGRCCISLYKIIGDCTLKNQLLIYFSFSFLYLTDIKYNLIMDLFNRLELHVQRQWNLVQLQVEVGL